MEQQEIYVIRLELLQEPLHTDVRIRAFRFGDAAFAKPDLGDDIKLVALDRFQRRNHIRMRAVEIREVKRIHAALVRFADQRLELFLAEPRVVRLTFAAAHAGAEDDAREFQLGLPDGDALVGIEGLGGQRDFRQQPRCEERSADAERGVGEEFATRGFHGATISGLLSRRNWLLQGSRIARVRW
jgi:hypothetical protein